MLFPLGNYNPKLTTKTIIMLQILKVNNEGKRITSIDGRARNPEPSQTSKMEFSTGKKAHLRLLTGFEKTPLDVFTFNSVKFSIF